MTSPDIFGFFVKREKNDYQSITRKDALQSTPLSCPLSSFHLQALISR